MSQPQVVTVPRHTRRTFVVFAILGILAGLVAGGAVYYRHTTSTPSTGPTPEAVVDQFLTGVFANSQRGVAELVAPLVCAGWAAQAAIDRVHDGLPSFVIVGWEDIQVLRMDDGHALVGARLALTPFSDTDPSDFPRWTFGLVDEDGWRVCEAQPVG